MFNGASECSIFVCLCLGIEFGIICIVDDVVEALYTNIRSDMMDRVDMDMSSKRWIDRKIWKMNGISFRCYSWNAAEIVHCFPYDCCVSCCIANFWNEDATTNSRMHWYINLQLNKYQHGCLSIALHSIFVFDCKNNNRKRAMFCFRKQHVTYPGECAKSKIYDCLRAIPYSIWQSQHCVHNMSPSMAFYLCWCTHCTSFEMINIHLHSEGFWLTVSKIIRVVVEWVNERIEWTRAFNLMVKS